MKKPRISIVTITYNSEKTLEETIKSVISQHYDNLEYLIIDGGSTDKTLSIVDKYKDSISFVISEPDNGISDAFNKGIRHATGDIIGLINSDDLLAPYACEYLAEAFDGETDVYRGNVIVWNDITGDKRICVPTMSFPITRYIKSVCHQGTFISKRAYSQFGGYRVDFRYMMDAELLHRYYRNGASFKYLDKELAIFRLGGVTNDDYKMKIKELKAMYKDNGASKWLILGHVTTFTVRQKLKKVLNRFIGPDIRQLNLGKYKK